LVVAIVCALSFSIPSFAQELKSKLLFEVTFNLKPGVEVGQTLSGKRTIYPVKDGFFEGPNLKGKVLPDGADWFLQLNETTNKIDVRVTLQTNEGENIYVAYQGYLKLNADGTYYFRTTPYFETSSKKLAYLNHTVSVGVGTIVKMGETVSYKVYEIL
ncbi:MAG: hypothetical protein RL449_705, partial [Bacteroidota bacterium]